MRYFGAPWGAVLMLLVCVGLVGCESGPPAPPQAQISPEQQLVDHARLAVANLRSGTYAMSGSLNSYLTRAKAVLVFPDLLQAGFIVGASGGTGVLLQRTATGWSDPAFYISGSGSFGLQIGAEGGSVIFLIMNDGALRKFVNGTSVNLGGDVSIAVGPYGAGAQGGTTTNAGADLVAFSAQQGIFGGVAVQGGVVTPRTEWNVAYYGPGATPQAILAGQFHNRGARQLIAALATTRQGAEGSSEEHKR
jgi:SH3 domain-containing YSC84-like protein 1